MILFLTPSQNLPQYKKRHPENVDLARQEYDEDLATLLLADKPDLVVCAGFMHVLSEQFLNPLAEARLPIVNLHPALPGQFSGANAIERAHEQWMRGEIDHSGIMLHYVVSEVDMVVIYLLKASLSQSALTYHLGGANTR